MLRITHCLDSRLTVNCEILREREREREKESWVRQAVYSIVRTIRNTQIQFVPHRKHHVSTTEANRLMLFRETVADYCEDLTQHTNALCGQNAKFLNPKAGCRPPVVTAVKGSRVNVRLCGSQQCF
jgi:hypothetical protein